MCGRREGWIDLGELVGTYEAIEPVLQQVLLGSPTKGMSACPMKPEFAACRGRASAPAPSRAPRCRASRPETPRKARE